MRVKVNKKALTNWSTYANLLMLLVAAVVPFITQLELDHNTKTYILMGMGCITTICQFIKQGGDNNAEDTES